MKKLFIALLVFTVACKKETTTVSEPANNAFNESELAVAITQHSALPSETDAAIKTSTLGNPTQTAYLPSNAAQRKDRLFIYIPGTWATPSLYDDVVSAAAKNGYYAFAVAYSNLSPIEFLVGSNPDNSTVENIFEEYLTGNNVSTKVNVTRANSFENRIIKMVGYMDSLYPSENWKRFLDNEGNITWEKLSVGGHSQGSDHTMYMSKKRKLFRAGFFGGPGSFKLNNGSYPAFMSQPGLTPVTSIYGFNHTQDPVRVWSEVSAVWEVLGLPGTPDLIDDKSINPDTRRLITSYPMSDAHSGIIQDELTPKNQNGTPVLEPVWRYMCFPK